MKPLKALKISEWETPASSYPEERVGNFRIGKHVYEKGARSYNGIDGYRMFYAENPLTLTTLQEFRGEKWNTWMVDAPTDYKAMQKYAEVSYGKVLTTGLGLGLVVHELCKNESVTEITVVEKSREVVTLVGKHLPLDNRITIKLDDFWKFIELDDSKWDFILVDLWVFHENDKHIKLYKEEVIPASKILKKKYPEARVIFHAFAGMPSLEEISTVLLSGKDVNHLIYGLSEPLTIGG